MVSRQCSLHLSYADGLTSIRIAGVIDVSNATRLEDTLGLVDGAIVVDCSRLDFIDVAGLKVLARASEEHDGMILRHASPGLCRLVHLAKLQHLFVLDPPADLR